MNAGIEALLARLGAKREEMLERAGQCQTATELVVWAERFNVKLTQEEAGELLQFAYGSEDELPDSELGRVSGGTAFGKPPMCPKCRKLSPYGSSTCQHCGEPL